MKFSNPEYDCRLSTTHFNIGIVLFFLPYRWIEDRLYATINCATFRDAAHLQFSATPLPKSNLERLAQND